MNQQTAPEYFLEHGVWSDPRAQANAFDSVDGTVPAIVSAVQGLLLHDYFGEHLYAPRLPTSPTPPVQHCQSPKG